ncbi:hypothetical protein V6Z93_004455 [Aspergillus fumigatus]
MNLGASSQLNKLAAGKAETARRIFTGVQEPRNAAIGETPIRKILEMVQEQTKYTEDSYFLVLAGHHHSNHHLTNSYARLWVFYYSHRIFAWPRATVTVRPLH